MDSNKKQVGYMHNQTQHNNHYNNNGGNNRGYNNHHSNNYNGNNRRMDKKKQNNNNNNNNANNANNYQYNQNENVQNNEQNVNYYNNIDEQQQQQAQQQQAVPAYHYYPVVQPQPIFYTPATDPHYYSAASQPPPIQTAGSPTAVGMYPPSGVIVATAQNLQVPNRVMTTMHQIPMYPQNQMSGYSPQQGQPNHQPRYSRHNNNRRSQNVSPNGNSNANHFSNSSTTTNIYISGLSSDVTDESFAEMCNSYGKIVSSKAIINTETNECKGFGFVMYENEEQARNAMDQLNKKGYHVSFAKDSLSARLKNLQDEDSTNIYISNIPLSMTDEQFLELFAPHNVISHTILKDQNGVSRGVGFARFETREIAKEIIEKYNNVKLEGSTNSLQVRFADSNAQKKLKEQVASKKYSNTPKIRYQNNLASPEQMITYQYYGSPVIPPTSPLPMPAQVPIISPNLYPGVFSPMMQPASPSLIYIDNMNNDGANMNEGYDSQSENVNSPVNASSPSSDVKVDKLASNMQNKLRIDEM